MNEDKHQHKTSHDDTGVFVASGGLKDKKKPSIKKSLILLATVSLFGGLLVWRSFAASAGSQSIVNSYYQTVVCRPADPQGLSFWGGRYDAATTQDAKNKVIAQMVAQLTASQEYKNKNNGKGCATPPPPTKDLPPGTPKTPADPAKTCGTTASNTTLVKGYYKTILKVNEPDAAGLAYWVNQLTICKKTEAEVQAYFKSKAPAPAARYQAKRAFPERKPGESDNEYKGRLALWLQGEWFNITQNCCGGLHDSYGWAERIMNKTWTVQQVLDHLNNTTGKNFRDQMADPNSEFAKEFEIRKKIKAAMMARLKAYIDGGGTLTGVSSFTNCEGLMKSYNEGYTDMVGQCFVGTGLQIGDEFVWTDKIMSGAVTLEEALAAIAAGQSSTPCVDEISPYMPSCNSGSRWVSGTDIDGFYNGDWDRIRDEMANNGTAAQPGQGGGEFQENNSPSASTTHPSANITNPDELNAAPQSPYADVTSKTKQISGASSAVTACMGMKCATLPVGKTKASDIKNSENTPVIQVEELPSCGEEGKATVCGGDGEYTEEWNNGGTKSNTIKPDGAESTLTADELKKCIDQYAKLEPGDDSVCVKIARIYLGLTGYDKVSDSTEYDADMQKAVEEFQGDQNVSNESGIVDKATWDKLKEVSTKVEQAKKRAARDQQIVAEVSNHIQRSNSAILFASCPRQPILRNGATGDCVRRVQQILALVQTVGLPITGRLDDATVKAIKQYQVAHKLKETGIVDKATWKLLESARDTEVYQSPYKGESGTVVNNRQ